MLHHDLCHALVKVKAKRVRSSRSVPGMDRSQQVTWSFYHRRKVMEGMQLATDTSAQGQTIYMPVTQALNVV